MVELKSGSGTERGRGLGFNLPGIFPALVLGEGVKWLNCKMAVGPEGGVAEGVTPTEIPTRDGVSGADSRTR